MRGILDSEKLHRDRVVGGAARVCNSKYPPLDEKALILIVTRPALTLLYGGANELGLERLIIP